VLERNVCFVDTPGYDSGTSMLEGMDSVLQYIEAQMAKNTSFSSMSDGDLLSMLGGDGGFQVDLVLYLISQSKSCPRGSFSMKIFANVTCTRPQTN